MLFLQPGGRGGGQGGGDPSLVSTGVGVCLPPLRARSKGRVRGARCGAGIDLGSQVISSQVNALEKQVQQVSPFGSRLTAQTQL